MNVHKKCSPDLAQSSRVGAAGAARRPGAIAVATAMGVTPKMVGKRVARLVTDGAAGLVDRSSRPHCLCRPTPEATAVRIEALRRQRWTGQQIAQETGVSPTTVSRVLKRLGLSP